MVADTLGVASFLALGIALAVETADRLRLHPMVSTIIVAIGAGLVAASGQKAMLAGLPLVGAMAGGAAVAVVLYRRRGFLATWVACLVAGLMIGAMAARSLGDPDLLRSSSLVMSMAAALLVLGAWGVIARRRAGAAGSTAQ